MRVAPPRLFRRSYRLSVTCAALFALAACDDEFVTYTPETTAERELRENRENLERTQGEGSLAGLGIGALLGAAGGGVQGAFAGAQVGRLGGAAAGGYVRQLQTTYAEEEQLLDAVARDLRTTNAAMDESIRAMRAAIDARDPGDSSAQVRTDRLRVEVAQTIEAAQQQEAFFNSTRSLIISDGIGSTQAVQGSIDPELARLRERVASMQNIANVLAEG